MRLQFKKIKRIPVQTASGDTLGYVRDCVFETEGQIVAQYIVKSSPLTQKTYTISRDQIISISDKIIIVQDSISASELKENSRKNSIPARPEPVAMREDV